MVSELDSNVGMSFGRVRDEDHLFGKGAQLKSLNQLASKQFQNIHSWLQKSDYNASTSKQGLAPL